MWMFGNALACGNAFVLKPSEKDPSPSLFLAETARRGRRAGRRLLVVHATRVAVDRLLEHPRRGRGQLRSAAPPSPVTSTRPDAARQARPGPRRSQEPHGGPGRRRCRDGGRRRRLGRLRERRRAVHGDRHDRRAVGDGRGPRSWRRIRASPPATVKVGREAIPRPRWAPSSPGPTGTKRGGYPRQRRGPGRHGRGRRTRAPPLPPRARGFFPWGEPDRQRRAGDGLLPRRDLRAGPDRPPGADLRGGASASSTTTRTATGRRSSLATAAPPASFQFDADAGMVASTSRSPSRSPTTASAAGRRASSATSTCTARGHPVLHEGQDRHQPLAGTPNVRRRPRLPPDPLGRPRARLLAVGADPEAYSQRKVRAVRKLVPAAHAARSASGR